MRWPRSGRRLIPVSLLFAGACYGYFPSRSTASATANDRVLVELTDAGAIALASGIGTSAAAVEGRLLTATDTALTLSVVLVRRRNGAEEKWTGERVNVPRSYVHQLTERHFSTGRTVLFSAGLVIAIRVIHDAFSGPTNSSGGGGMSGAGSPK